jgi:hypothetical protein
MSGQVKVVRRAVRQFAEEFIENPYLCYTEHLLHVWHERDYTLIVKVADRLPPSVPRRMPAC